MSDNMPGVKSAEWWFAQRPTFWQAGQMIEDCDRRTEWLLRVQLDAFNAGRRQGADEEAARIKTRTEMSGTPRPDVL